MDTFERKNANAELNFCLERIIQVQSFLTKWKAFGNKTLHLYNHSLFYVTWTELF